MHLMTALLLVTLADAPVFEVATVSGDPVSGSLVSIDSNEWTINVDGQPQKIAAGSVLEARLKQSAPRAAASVPHTVTLGDGSRLSVSAVSVQGDTVTVESPELPAITLPRTSLAAIRLAESPSTVDDKWDEYVSREKKQDMVVIRKGETLDFVEGVVGNITTDSVNLLLDGDNVPVPRARVFGILYYQRSAAGSKTRGFLDLVGGDRLALAALTLKDGTVSATLTAGAEFPVPLTSVSGIDFSLEKLTWLSVLKPRDIKHEFRFIDPAPSFENDRDVYGRRLRLGRTTYSRGVCIRSRTSLSYRLDGDYSRLQAWLGIQHGYAGEVQVVISADGQRLFEGTVSAADAEPRRIDLDVKDRFSIEVLVDFGSVENDIGDHLVLGDARLLR